MWIGVVSSLVGHEGFDVLLEAAALLHERGHDTPVLLGGHGATEPMLRRRATELGLTAADAVRLVGKLAHRDAIHHVQSLDVVVVPHRDLPVTRSVTPLKPAEAMALCRPVVLSDIPPLAELAHTNYIDSLRYKVLQQPYTRPPTFDSPRAMRGVTGASRAPLRSTAPCRRRR